MTKRVAWFTGEPGVKDCFTPHKVYEVVREETTNFSVINDKGIKNYCLKKGCARICQGDWVFADVVEQAVEQTVAKPKKARKWGDWVEHNVGGQPAGLDDQQTVKVKWGDGDITKDCVWVVNWGSSAKVTHYKVKLKDISKDTSKPKKNTDWQDNVLGFCPVPPNKIVEAKLACGETLKWEADSLNWSDTPMKGRNIVKWRLAD